MTANINSFVSRAWTSPMNPFASAKIITSRFCLLKDSGYALSTQVGTGKFATVYMAKKIDTQETFAVKAISKRNASRSDIAREIKILNMLGHHRNVLQLVDSFEDNTAWHIVTPLYEGGELFDRIIEIGSFQERDAAENTEQILQALIHTHSKNIVHRDIKPENLLFLNHNQSAPLVLVDYGMARDWASGDPPMSTQCGSFSYVAPEVLDRSYTNLCDSWSAGVVLHIMLSGRTPFGDGSEDEILANVRNAKLDFNHESWKGVSQQAKELVASLMERNVKKRFTPEQALQSVWFKTHIFRDRPLEEARERLVKFIAHRKLKRAAIKIIAQLVIDEREASRIRSLMSSMDRDNRGRVSLRQVVESTGVLASGAPSLPGAGQDVGYVDPLEIMASAVKSSVYLRQRHLEAVFKKLDSSGDGKIDLAELKMALKQEGSSENDAEEVMRDADVDGDGFISFEEFCKVMNNQS